MRLYAVDHVFVTLEDHGQLCTVLVPDKDAPTVTSAEHKVLTPEVGLLYLKSAIRFMMKRRKIGTRQARGKLFPYQKEFW